MRIKIVRRPPRRLSFLGRCHLSIYELIYHARCIGIDRSSGLRDHLFRKTADFIELKRRDRGEHEMGDTRF